MPRPLTQAQRQQLGTAGRWAWVTAVGWAGIAAVFGGAVAHWMQLGAGRPSLFVPFATTAVWFAGLSVRQAVVLARTASRADPVLTERWIRARMLHWWGLGLGTVWFTVALLGAIAFENGMFGGGLR